MYWPEDYASVDSWVLCLLTDYVSYYKHRWVEGVVNFILGRMTATEITCGCGSCVHQALDEPIMLGVEQCMRHEHHSSWLSVGTVRATGPTVPEPVPLGNWCFAQQHVWAKICPRMRLKSFFCSFNAKPINIQPKMNHVTPVSFPDAAYAERKKSDVTPACSWLSSLLTHTNTYIHR